MEEKAKLSITEKNSDKWLNLLLAALVTLFFILFVTDLFQGDWCRSVDFCGYYSAGQIMNDGKIADIYDLDLLGKYQAELYSSINAIDKNTEIIAIPYFAIFLLPFKLFALIDLPLSLLLWYGINFGLLIFYLYYFSRKVSGKALPIQALFLILVSYPLFRTFAEGQVNIFLLICIGEFLRAITSDKPYRAGMWLGGWLLKPQLLILLLPFLLIQKKYKVLLGFIYSSILILGVSFLLAGWEGVIGLKNIIFESAEGGATSHYELMMNWRAVGFYASVIFNPDFGQFVFICGSLITAGVPLVVFRRELTSDDPMFVIEILGILAATTAVAYHAHIHTAIILIPALLYLYLKGILPRKILFTWVIIPDAMYVYQFIAGAVVVLTGPLPVFSTASFIAFRQNMIIANLVLLGWAIKQKKLRGKFAENELLV